VSGNCDAISGRKGNRPGKTLDSVLLTCDYFSGYRDNIFGIKSGINQIFTFADIHTGSWNLNREAKIR
jgi:hypothetical protein